MKYNEAYFERGIETGVSLYTNYRWMPEQTISLAMALIDKLCIGRQSRILDFGCAKGYLVKALRILWRDAYGVDLSRYAIQNCDPQVEEYVIQCNENEPVPWDFDFDICIAKDVFEHIPNIEAVVYKLRKKCRHLFAVIPLGDGKRFNVPAYDLDKTHIIAQPPEWWMEMFTKHGWTLKEFCYRKHGIKDNWAEHATGNGFFELS